MHQFCVPKDPAIVNASVAYHILLQGLSGFAISSCLARVIIVCRNLRLAVNVGGCLQPGHF